MILNFENFINENKSSNEFIDFAIPKIKNMMFDGYKINSTVEGVMKKVSKGILKKNDNKLLVLGNISNLSIFTSLYNETIKKQDIELMGIDFGDKTDIKDVNKMLTDIKEKNNIIFLINSDSDIIEDIDADVLSSRFKYTLELDKLSALK